MEVIGLVGRRAIRQLELTRRQDNGRAVRRIDLCVAINAIVAELYTVRVQNRHRRHDRVVEDQARQAPKRVNVCLVVNLATTNRAPIQQTGRGHRCSGRQLCIQIVNIRIRRSHIRVGPDVAVDHIHRWLDRRTAVIRAGKSGARLGHRLADIADEKLRVRIREGHAGRCCASVSRIKRIPTSMRQTAVANVAAATGQHLAGAQ